MSKPPLLTKPAGWFVQLIGAVVVIVGVLMTSTRTEAGIVTLVIGLALLWLGRQTRPRE